MDTEDISKQHINELATAFIKYIPLLAGTAGMKATRFFTAEVIEPFTQEMINNRVCNVRGVLDYEEIEYKDVNLSMERADGLIQIPAVGSTVLVGKMPDGETYILHCSDVSRVICYIDGSNSFVFDSGGFVFNGGSLGGMVKVIDLTTKLNNLENTLNALITAIGVTWVPVPNDGGAALKTLIATLGGSSLALITPTVQANIEDTKIKH